MSLPVDVICPAFPHLPDDVAFALAKYDAGIADGTLPIGPDGYVVIPDSDEAWIADNVIAHVHFGEV